MSSIVPHSHTSPVYELSQEIQDQLVASYGNGTTKMIIPKSSFGYNAVVISQESSSDKIESLIQGARNVYDATRELLFVWQKDEVTDYLHYREDSPNYAMQITPFPRTSWALLQQLSFLKNVTLGTEYSQNPIEAESFREKYNQLKDAGEFENIESFLKEAPSLDLPDFNLEQMKQQEVIKGVFTKVFINYKPTAPVHLLIIPDRPDAKRFSDLTRGEFIEIHLLSEKIKEIYKEANGSATISIFSKTGQQAGQTVGRNHFHITVGETQSKLRLALSYLRKIFLPYAPLSADAISAQVIQRKVELSKLPAFIESYRADLDKKTD
ncbi:HIT family protein [Candidatus Rhabdochlamydia sp. T3358]|uniref:HIT family protein n=1 Tax=Candidatus Rhabdochlamydia sp. T3358 TaxID=2099795 RepID=UPI0010B51BB5|nr:HIT family protein [Candidatus Rhabdochlamydia sp. T3358]VHO02107.1 HIT domain protein [Candidatus Rhabdochlamydia sp. T3358]